jgi:hypothetical protein
MIVTKQKMPLYQREYIHRSATLILSVFLFLLMSIPGYSTIRYVKAGNPAPVPPYTTWATASDSIQKVVDICLSGDTILIGTGVYRETVVSEHPGRYLIIIGVDVDSCIVDLSGFDLFTTHHGFMMEDNLVLENMSIKTYNFNTWHTGIWINGLSSSNIRIKIMNNKFIGGFQFSLSLWNVNGIISNNLIRRAQVGVEIRFTPEQSNMIVSDNLIIDTRLIGLSTTHGMIVKNMILRSSNDAFEFYPIGGSRSELYGNLLDGGVDGIQSVKNKAQNNIIRNMVNAVAPYGGMQKIDFQNNIIDSCETVIDFSQGGVVTGNISYNNFYGYDEISTDTTKLNPDTLIYSSFDPMYESLDSTNYRLQMYSPLIDAGDPGILDNDGSRSDIGRYGGPYGESYQYKDLPPKKPRFTLVTKQNGKIIFNWQGGTEADFNLFSLHRDRNPQFMPDESNLIYSDRDTIYSDSLLDPTGNYTYKITAKDNQGLISRWDSVTVVLTDIADGPELTPEAVVLYQNYPNPFNPSTTIRFRLDSPGEVILRVYDVNGALVTVLNNGWLPAGEHERDFTPGKVGSMDDIASGVYFYNLTVRDENLKPVFIKSDKMMFIK